MHGVRLKKSLGQNFLGDPVWLNRIVAAAGVAAQDTVLEIGAGAGSLTRPLAQAAQRVLAVEIDGRLLPVLRAVLAGLANVHLHHGDILEQDLGQLLAAAGLESGARSKLPIDSSMAAPRVFDQRAAQACGNKPSRTRASPRSWRLQSQGQSSSRAHRRPCPRRWPAHNAEYKAACPVE